MKNTNKVGTPKLETRSIDPTALGPPRSPAAKPKLEPKPAPTPPKKSDEIVRKKGK